MAVELGKINRRGKQYSVRSIPIGQNNRLIIKGGLIKTGEVFDEFWIRRQEMPGLPEIVDQLIHRRDRPDILTSCQKLPNIAPLYAYYYEWDNIAVVQFESYKEWFEKQVARDARSQIRKSAREGIRTEIVPFTDDFVNGIYSIYNEIPVRQGRKFWHYGKDTDTVKQENGTYLDRSVFIGAFYEDQLAGFIKIVFDEEVAMLMQILSKSAFFGKRPNNALLAKAIEVCEQRQAHYLTYGQYAYGKKERSSLIEFKKSFGFKKVDIPRYYIPLTFRGRVALKLRLHKGLRDCLPASLNTRLIWIRAKLYRLHRSSS